jgi:hypothetical protein
MIGIKYCGALHLFYSFTDAVLQIHACRQVMRLCRFEADKCNINKGDSSFRSPNSFLISRITVAKFGMTLFGRDLGRKEETAVCPREIQSPYFKRKPPVLPSSFSKKTVSSQMNPPGQLLKFRIQ